MQRGAPLFPEARKRHRVYGGLSERQERAFYWIAGAVILLFMAGWIGSLIATRREERAERLREAAAGHTPAAPAPPVTHQVTNAILAPDAPKSAYINDAMLAFLNPLRGQSGRVRFTTSTPGTPIAPAPNGATAVLSQGG